MNWTLKYDFSPDLQIYKFFSFNTLNYININSQIVISYANIMLVILINILTL